MPVTPDTEIYAALDLGSNSFHLLVASFVGDKIRVVDRHKELIRLASGLDEDGHLSDEILEQAQQCLSRIAERIRHIPKDHTRVVGTNTLRAAKGAEKFLRNAEETLGVPINIISGTEEARLTWIGVAHDYALSENQRLVIDIGGGSTELVVGKQQPSMLESLPMGCVSFTQRFFPNGNLNEKSFKKAINKARQLISPYLYLTNSNWEEVVGASGTIRNLELILDTNGWNKDHRITLEGLEKIAERLLEYKHIDEVKISGLKESRRPVIPGGLAILTALFQELELKAMHASSYAIREGVIHDLAGRLHHHDKRAATVQHFMLQYNVNNLKAERISELALAWLPAFKKKLSTPYDEAEKLLDWGAKLHEIGMAIAHGGYHKHGAYILSNADMPGFSRREQKQLSFLVLNHRRKLKDPVNGEYGLEPDWYLLAILRLALLFNRRRHSHPVLEAIKLRCEKSDIVITIPQKWIDASPLTEADLYDEIDIFAVQNITIRIEIQA